MNGIKKLTNSIVDELELIIKENPDEITAGDVYVDVYDSDARAFGWYKGILTVGEDQNVYHYGLGEEEFGVELNRWDFVYPGRLWLGEKVITFWQYPSKKDFKKIMKELGRHPRVKQNLLASPWEIEILVGPNDEWIKGTDRKDWDGEINETKMIPTSEYDGSAKRSAKEMAQQHMVSPLLKKKRKVWDKRLKLPKGMTMAQYNAMRSRYQFSEGVLNENPDKISTFSSDESASFSDKDARAFGWYKGQLLVGESYTDLHGDLGYYIDKNISRKDLKYAGRLWIEKKIISFWDYPPINQFNKLMKQLGNNEQVGENLLSKGWKIEIVSKNDAGDIDTNLGDYQWESDHTRIIPTTEYAGSEARSNREKAMQHMVSPLLKKKRKVWDKRLKLPKGMTMAQYNAMKTRYQFSEGTLNENPDGVDNDEPKVYVGADNWDARAFGWYKGELLVGEDPSDWHGYLGQSAGYGEAPNRWDFLFPGRVWIESKVISFWDYPPKNMFVKLMKQLGNHKNIKKNLFGKGWVIEILVDAKGEILTNDSSKNWGADRETKIIPTTEYNGSAARSAKEKAMQHMVSPLLKKKRKVWDKRLKLPAGMTMAQYNAMRSRYQFSEGVINENPDVVKSKYFDEVYKYNDKDARAFGWNSGQLAVGTEPEEFHYKLGIYDFGTDSMIKLSRDEFEYPGRLWLDRKVISFWEFPKPNEFNKLMKQLGNHRNVNKDLLSKGWRIEVVFVPKSDDEIFTNFTNRTWDNKFTHLVPTTEYNGSEKRSAKEKAKQHMVSPLLKDKQKVWDKRLKLPKGMTMAEYKALMTRYQFSEGVIAESPDWVGDLDYKDDDAIAFGWYNSELFIGLNLHDNLENDNGENPGRFGMDYPGRIWPEAKMISFWEYPPVKKYNRMMRELSKSEYVGENLLGSGWKIEIVLGKDGKVNIDHPKSDWQNNEEDTKIIPTSDYDGSAERSAKEMAQQHMVSPLLKKKRKVWDKRLKLPKGMTMAEYDAMKTRYQFSEGVIKENPDKVKEFGLTYEDDEARAFGWWKGLPYVSDAGEAHYNIDLDLSLNRSRMDFSGRIWLETKIISFWKYPPKDKFNKLMKELGKHEKITQNLLSNGWKVEVVLTDASDKIDIDFKDDMWNTAHVKLIPTSEYAGSGERSPREKAMQHVLSPTLKAKRKVWDKRLKLPTGMTMAEYKALMTRYQFSEGVIKENPDRVSSSEFGEYAEFSEWDARAFGWWDGEVYVGESSNVWHNGIEIWSKRAEDWRNIEREDFEYAGRLWIEKKIISFWDYPPINKFNKLMKQLGNKCSINLLGKGWKIEVVPKNDAGDIDTNLNDTEWESFTTNIIPTTEYAGSGERSSREKAQQHMVSPLLKKDRKVWDKRLKLPKGMTTAEYHALMTRYQFSEGVVVENPDEVDSVNFDTKLKYSNKDARAFGWYQGKLYVGKDNEEYHHKIRIWDEESQDTIQLDRGGFKYSGRIWVDRKIMSFWDYPNKDKFKQVMKELGQHENIKQNLMSKGWFIEVVYIDGTTKLDTDIGDIGWSTPFTHVIPTSEYNGSEKRSAKEKAKQHMVSPLLKAKKKVWDKRLKLPAGMTMAEYKALMTRYQFSEGVIIESPDEVPDLPQAHCDAYDARAFGWYKGKIMVGTHSKMYHMYFDIGKSNPSRDDFDYPGRIWIDKKIISFWEYPEIGKYKKLMKELGNNLEVNQNLFSKGWRVEVVKREDGEINTADNWVNKRWNKHMDGVKLIPTSEYDGSAERSAKEKAQQHMMSPLLKTKRKVWDKRLKLPKGMTMAQYDAMKTRYQFSEGVLSENPDRIEKTQSHYLDDDAIAFGWYNNRPFCTHKTHGDILNGEGNRIGRNHMSYLGRLWLKDKILSFWEYPEPKDFNKLMKELGKHKVVNQNLLGKGWRVEIVVKKDNSIETDTDSNWDSGETKIIPTVEYNGSEARSDKEKAMQHVLSPTLKAKRKVWDKRLKLPTGMTMAEYKALMTRYKFQEGVLNENPDGDRLGSLEYYDQDARCFGWHNGKLYVNQSDTHGDFRDTHLELYKENPDMDREDFDFAGRLWLNSKIISFWQYPSKKKFEGILKKLSKHELINTNLLGKGWSVEIVLDVDNKMTWDVGDAWDTSATDQIPTTEYAGSGERSAKERAQQHMASPLLKTKRKVWDKRLKLPKGMTMAEYHALMTRYQFSESILPTEKTVERILDTYILKDSNVKLIERFASELNGDIKLIKEITANSIDGTDADDGPATWYVNFRHYSKGAKEVAEKAGMKIIDYLITGIPKNYKETDDYGDAIAVSFFPAGVVGKATATNYADWKGSKAYREWRKWITNVAVQMGFEYASKIDNEEKQRAIDTTKGMKGEEDGIQNLDDNDENGIIESIINDLF